MSGFGEVSHQEDSFQHAPLVTALDHERMLLDLLAAQRQAERMNTATQTPRLEENRERHSDI